MVRRHLLLILLFGLLSGCQSIEHESDVVAKTALPNVHLMQPKVLWRNTAGASAKDRSHLRLALLNDQVVMADQKGVIRGLDSHSGRDLWKVETKENIISGPSIIHGRIFVTTQDGKVLSVLPDKGIVWSVSLNNPIYGAVQGNARELYAQTVSGRVFALKTDSGSQVWEYSTHIPTLVLAKTSSPLLYRDSVLVGFSNGRLISFDQRSGILNWEKEIVVASGRSETQRMIDISADMVLKSGIVYVVSYQGKLIALQADSGDFLWDQEVSSYSGLAVSEQAVVVSDQFGLLWAYNRSNGHKLWEQPDLKGRRLSAPVFVQSKLICGDDEGFVHVLEAKNGQYLGRISVDSKPVTATPIVSGKIVYVLSQSGRVTALSIE